MNQFFKSEKAELNIHPIGLILSEIHVNISFCTNVKIFGKSVKLDIHKKVSCSLIEWGSVLLDRNLLLTPKPKFFCN